jgi:DNA mismatch repair protein MutS
MPDPRDTPAMRQFARFKARHPDCILLFRIGDFYETFDDDAVTLHKALGLTLTQRTEGLPMAGVPYHQLEVYLRRLIQQGFRVAVCEQVQDPKEAKGIVERAVTRVLTPGTLVDEPLLEESAVNRLAALAPADLRNPERIGVAMVEVSTGAFTVFEVEARLLTDELASRGVQELLFADPGGSGARPPAVEGLVRDLGVAVTARPAWQFRPSDALEAVLEQYGVATTAGFGLRDEEPCVWAAGAIIRYLRETQTPSEEARATGTLARMKKLLHLQPPRRDERGSALVLDAVSLRSLEVERTIRAAGRNGGAAGAGEGSLVGVFLSGPGACRTPMGKRQLREWLCRPLRDLEAIRARHRCVGLLVEDRRTAAALGEALEGVQDVARIAGRIALGRCTPRDLVALGRSLARVEQLAGVLENAGVFAARRAGLLAVREALLPLAEEIGRVCVEAAPAHLREGGLFRDGVDPELDECRGLQRDAGAWLSRYQEGLILEHGLPGIKVGFNRVFGYYIELTAAQARSAPAAFSRKQTLKNAERYITPELKEFEEKVMSAEGRALERERALFEGLCGRAAGCIPHVAAFGREVAELDVLLCFAEKAVRRGWTCPEMAEEPVLRIRQGRHPVLEQVLGDGFVPNDIDLGRAEGEPGVQRHGTERQRDNGARQAAGPDGPPVFSSPSSLALITGPNMAGKSTFIRQTALIVLLAHAGAFVPAEAARIGVCDRVFTRVGADDALHAGQSTFMVEMTETATILNNCTPASLVILDEIGRGTSTLDGLSLAWAIAEFLAGAGGVEGGGGGGGGERGPRTLFATHYHELTELEERLAGRVKNLHVSVREWGDQIVFLHRIQPGRSDRSYGVHVARLAGIPGAVVARAGEVLASLAVQHGPATGGAGGKPAVPAPAPAGQMSLFTEYLDHPAIGELRELKLEGLSPMQAFDALRRLREMVGETVRR